MLYNSKIEFPKSLLIDWKREEAAYSLRDIITHLLTSLPSIIYAPVRLTYALPIIIPKTKIPKTIDQNKHHIVLLQPCIFRCFLWGRLCRRMDGTTRRAFGTLLKRALRPLSGKVWRGENMLSKPRPKCARDGGGSGVLLGKSSG